MSDTEQEAFFVWCNYKSHDLGEEDADDLYVISGMNIKGNMTMKKISPMKL